MIDLNPFHLAIPVENLKLCRSFYSEVLGCKEGRSSKHWVDFDFFGHQLVIHETARRLDSIEPPTNMVDGHEVPIPHFGVVLKWDTWTSFVNKLRQKDIQFLLEPCIRFKGEAGEQATMFFQDPEGNALEFKSFKNPSHLFND